MAHTTDIRPHGAGLMDRFAALRADLAARAARRKLYRTTLNELRQLSDRELSDLGIHRSMINAIAREAALKG